MGIGLLCALRLSGREALRDEVAALLEAQGTAADLRRGIDRGRARAAAERDKKRAGGSVPFVLVEAPGQVVPGHVVDSAELRAAVEEVRGG